MANLKIDFHVHSIHSKDGSIPIEDLLRTAKRMGLNTVCITDHNNTKGGLEGKKLAKTIGINVIVGQEVRTEKGEILVYGVEKTLQKGKDLEETCKLAKELGGYIAIPHPYDFLRSGAKDKEKIIKYVDAIEIFNSRCFFNRFNKKAQEFARKNNISMIAGSDAHFKHEIGNVVNSIKARPNVKSIFSSLKKQKPEMETKKFQRWKYIICQIKRRLGLLSKK
ncbi:MAG: PHP domain-containing protein [Candidatus Aenigmarchaeota archaeon]|nr:PHP domain-containing protein [Candidatus Aenigmarchaeota archaeon]